METSKSFMRRLKEGWFEKYCPADKIGIDIGCGHDPVNHTFRRFDKIFGDGDATLMEGFPNNTYWTVYTSHLLEHLHEPEKAIKRWYELVKPGGHLIICVPHRDLYERKKTLPSKWNIDHKWFWLPNKEEYPHTKNLLKTVKECTNGLIVLHRVLDEGYDYNLPLDKHPVGEYSIEIIVKKT